jgi:hypothetical protein
MSYHSNAMLDNVALLEQNCMVDVVAIFCFFEFNWHVEDFKFIFRSFENGWKYYFEKFSECENKMFLFYSTLTVEEKKSLMNYLIFDKYKNHFNNLCSA